MNLTYLVDLENICAKPLYQYAEKHQDGEYIIFYSENTSSPNSILEGLPEEIKVSFVGCKTGGHNAMDFCISGMAGRLSVGRLTKIKILSNDKGYDPVIRMLQEKGTRITREGVSLSPKEGKEGDLNYSNIDPVSDLEDYAREQDIKRMIRKSVPKKYQGQMTDAILHAIDRKEAHEMCQAILPDNMATTVYRKLRKYIPREVG